MVVEDELAQVERGSCLKFLVVSDVFQSVFFVALTSPFIMKVHVCLFVESSIG